MHYLLIIIGFIFLIKGADFLVDGASSLAKEMEVSDLVIGLTVVSFGTSSPELFVNLLASIQDDVGIAVGNVLGMSPLSFSP
jgi:cation:H+ antiporter